MLTGLSLAILIPAFTILLLECENLLSVVLVLTLGYFALIKLGQNAEAEMKYQEERERRNESRNN